MVKNWVARVVEQHDVLVCSCYPKVTNRYERAHQIISFYLIAILFGYSSILVEHIRRDRALLAHNNATLERTNRELQSIHNLALTMQSSAIDGADVQEIILTTIGNSTGFERAMLAIVDQD